MSIVANLHFTRGPKLVSGPVLAAKSFWPNQFFGSKSGPGGPVFASFSAKISPARPILGPIPILGGTILI